MRFLMLMDPEPEAALELSRYNEELMKAGVLLAADGLRVIQASSREEALEWARRCPIGDVEVRRIA